MAVRIVSNEISPDISVMGFTGQLALGRRLNDVEDAVRERIEQGSKKIVLDLGGVDLIDSAGVGVLVVCIRAMERAGGLMALAGAAPRVRQLIELNRLNQVVSLFSDVPSAGSALSTSVPLSVRYSSAGAGSA
jgi:anti-sigma B factor antagonist